MTYEEERRLNSQYAFDAMFGQGAWRATVERGVAFLINRNASLREQVGASAMRATFGVD